MNANRAASEATIKAMRTNTPADHTLAHDAHRAAAAYDHRTGNEERALVHEISADIHKEKAAEAYAAQAPAINPDFFLTRFQTCR